MSAAWRRLRSDVPDGPSGQATDPRAGTRVAVAFPLAATAIALAWVATSPRFPFLLVPHEDLVLLAVLAAFYGRFPVELGPRTVFTFEMPLIVLSGLLGGPLVGSLVGMVGGASDEDFVWRRNAAYGGLGACSGAAAGFVGAAWQQGAFGVEVAACLAVGAVVATTFVGRQVVRLDRGVPPIPLLSADSTRELAEGVLAAPVVALLAATYAAERQLVLAAICAGGVAVMLVTRALRTQRLAHESERRTLLRDRLTGAARRAAFEEALELEWHRVLGGAHPAGVLMIDADNFKEVNDTYGHSTGDGVLRELVERVASAARGSDLLARWGGEELCLLLPAIGSTTELETSAERVRATVSDRTFAVPGAEMRITVSVGGTLLDGSLEPWAILERVDEALYVAKRQRNDVCVLPPRDAGMASATARKLALGA